MDSGLYKDLLGLNLFTYCYNDPVNYVDMFGESAEAVLYAWMTCGGAVAAAEPTPIGDIIYLLGLLVIGIVVECDDAEPKNYINPIISANDWSQSDLIQDSGNKVASEEQSNGPASVEEARTKEEVDPNRRPDQKNKEERQRIKQDKVING